MTFDPPFNSYSAGSLGASQPPAMFPFKRCLSLNRGVILHLARNASSQSGDGGTSTYRNITVETQGQIQIISINRPEKRNCVNHETALELYNAFRSFDKDEGVRVGVLSGKGGTFCAGYDLAELAAAGGTDVSPETVLRPFGVGSAPMVCCPPHTCTPHLTHLYPSHTHAGSH